MTNPIFVAEVLSPSAEGLDRGAKSSEYRASASLRQYALLSQDQAWVEIHTRDDAGSIAGCEWLRMAAIYEGVLAAG